MSAQGPLSAPQGCSVSPDNGAALHATASCFAIGYRDGLGLASPRPTVCLEFPIKIGNTSPLTCSLQDFTTSWQVAARGHLVKWLRSTTPLKRVDSGSTIREAVPLRRPMRCPLPAVLTKWSLPDRHRSLGVPAPLAHCSLRAACSRVRCGTPS